MEAWPSMENEDLDGFIVDISWITFGLFISCRNSALSLLSPLVYIRSQNELWVDCV